MIRHPRYGRSEERLKLMLPDRRGEGVSRPGVGVIITASIAQLDRSAICDLLYRHSSVLRMLIAHHASLSETSGPDAPRRSWRGALLPVEAHYGKYIVAEHCGRHSAAFVVASSHYCNNEIQARNDG
jgi:hypothetical protein